MSKIIGVESKCGCGKSTWLIERGIIEPEFADVQVDEATYNRDLGMITFDDQLKFVQYKINEFKEKIKDPSEDVFYMDRGLLSPIAFGAGYYEWYGLSDSEIDSYLKQCFDLMNQLPIDWKDYLEVLLLVPENDEDIKKRIVHRGRKFEVDHIDDILSVNNKYFKYLITLLEDFGVEYHLQVIKHNEYTD